jgi:hypothetical protein
MSAAMLAFDTHQYVRTLKEAGVNDAQAQAQSSALTQALAMHHERFATKDDLKLLGAELRGEMKEMREQLRGEIKELRAEIAPLRWMIAPSAIMMLFIMTGTAVMLFKTFTG